MEPEKEPLIFNITYQDLERTSSLKFTKKTKTSNLLQKRFIIFFAPRSVIRTAQK